MKLDRTLPALIDWVTALHNVFSENYSADAVPISQKMMNYLLFIKPQYPEPPARRRDVVLDNKRVISSMVVYENREGKRREFPSLRITVPNAAGEKLDFVDDTGPIVKSQKARNILWACIAFNLFDLASVWVDDNPDLKYDPSKQDTQPYPWLCWETLTKASDLREQMSEMTNSVVLSYDSFKLLCQAITRTEVNVDELRTSGAEDEAALRFKAEGESDMEDLTQGAEEAPQTEAVPPPDETKGVDPPRKFQRAKDEKAQENVLVYAALACAAGAGFIYYS
jgi:hypothetical protein